MDVGRAITYVFEDAEWLKKVAIGGLLLFVPVFGWLVVAGYLLRLIRQAYLGAERSLPEWDDFGGDLIRGFQAFVAAFVWSLPIWAFSIGLLCVFIALGMIEGRGPDAVSTIVGALAVVGMIGIYLGLFVLQLLFSALLPLFLSRLAVTDSLGSAFEFGAIFREIRLVPVPLLIVVLLQLGLNLLAGFGVILCVVGVVFTYFVSYLMLAHLFGQLRRQIDEREPITTAAPAPSV